jgi:hypothetical protein
LRLLAAQEQTAPTSPFAATAPLVPVRRTRLWVEALVIGWLLWIYDDINNLAPIRQVAAIHHATALWSFERSLHLTPELTLNRWLAARPGLGLVLADYYDIAHFAVTLGLLGWIWYARPDIFRPLRNSLVLINVIGLVIFWRYPLAPPRMLTGAGFTDVVANTHAFASWHTGSLAQHANELAAMPSLHIAWAAWSALVIWRAWGNRFARAAGILYVALTALIVMATGNHYLMDIVGGLLTMALAVVLGDRLAAVRWSRRGKRAEAAPAELLEQER